MSLDEIQARVDAVAEGPWGVVHYKFSSNVVTGRTRFGPNVIANTTSPKTAEFIAAARTAVPELLEENAKQRAALDAVLELHRPDSDGDCVECGVDVCENPFPYPCDTANAITEALA